MAFWSPKVRDDLFPRWDKQNIKIICDISMSCNSRSTLEFYGAPKNRNLRVHDGLHAKIYISSAGAVISSANASLNGIGLQSSTARNLEAGVFFPPHTAGWHDASRLFEELWRAPIIDEMQLARAPKIASDPEKRISPAEPKNASMFELIKGYPEIFSSVLFISEHEIVLPEDEASARERYNAAESAGSFEPKNRVLILNADASGFPPVPRNALMFFHDGKGKSFEVRGFYDVVTVRNRDTITLWGVQRWDRFWSKVGLTAPERKLSANDRAFIISLNEGSWSLSWDDFSRILLENMPIT